jgi:hypothetical protein
MHCNCKRNWVCTWRCDEDKRKPHAGTQVALSVDMVPLVWRCLGPWRHCMCLLLSLAESRALCISFCNRKSCQTLFTLSNAVSKRSDQDWLGREPFLVGDLGLRVCRGNESGATAQGPRSWHRCTQLRCSAHHWCNTCDIHSRLQAFCRPWAPNSPRSGASKPCHVCTSHAAQPANDHLIRSILWPWKTHSSRATSCTSVCRLAAQRGAGGNLEGVAKHSGAATWKTSRETVECWQHVAFCHRKGWLSIKRGTSQFAIESFLKGWLSTNSSTSQGFLEVSATSASAGAPV